MYGQQMYDYRAESAHHFGAHQTRPTPVDNNRYVSPSTSPRDLFSGLTPPTSARLSDDSLSFDLSYKGGLVSPSTVAAMPSSSLPSSHHFFEHMPSKQLPLHQEDPFLLPGAQLSSWPAPQTKSQQQQDLNEFAVNLPTLGMPFSSNNAWSGEVEGIAAPSSSPTDRIWTSGTTSLTTRSSSPSSIGAVGIANTNSAELKLDGLLPPPVSSPSQSVVQSARSETAPDSSLWFPSSQSTQDADSIFGFSSAAVF